MPRLHMMYFQLFEDAAHLAAWLVLNVSVPYFPPLIFTMQQANQAVASFFGVYNLNGRSLTEQSHYHFI